jgi:formylglycine-generating enzyme required for sulfatase activity
MNRIHLILILVVGLTACRSAAPTIADGDSHDTVPADAQTLAADPFAIFTATPPGPATATAAAVPPETRLSAIDGMTQVFVPAGTVQMGGLDVNSENDELPNHFVRIRAFWIDQLEVTNGMHGLCVQAGVCRPPVRNNSQNRPSYFDNPEFRDYRSFRSPGRMLTANGRAGACPPKPNGSAPRGATIPAPFRGAMSRPPGNMPTSTT